MVPAYTQSMEASLHYALPAPCLQSDCPTNYYAEHSQYNQPAALNTLSIAAEVAGIQWCFDLCTHTQYSLGGNCSSFLRLSSQNDITGPSVVTDKYLSISPTAAFGECCLCCMKLRISSSSSTGASAVGCAGSICTWWHMSMRRARALHSTSTDLVHLSWLCGSRVADAM